VTSTRKPKLLSASRSTGLANRPQARQSVSLTSAQRFAARVRARRRRRVLIVLTALVALGAISWVAFKSPWATVNRVQVSGTNRVDASAVRAAADTELGHPMLLARTGDVEARVAAQRLVKSVTVTRSWSGTLRVQVVERTPVAALPGPSGLKLVDEDGVVIEQIPDTGAALPDGLPRIQVSLTGVLPAETLRSCLSVLRGLPTSIRSRLISIGADSPDGVLLKLTDPKVKGTVQVEWGNAAQSAQKVQVLIALMRQHASIYDIRSPDTPAVKTS
jgi:cell division protein FtsQ